MPREKTEPSLRPSVHGARGSCLYQTSAAPGPKPCLPPEPRQTGRRAPALEATAGSQQCSPSTSAWHKEPAASVHLRAGGAGGEGHREQQGHVTAGIRPVGSLWGLAPRGCGHSLILGEHCPREAVAAGAVNQPQRLLAPPSEGRRTRPARDQRSPGEKPRVRPTWTRPWGPPPSRPPSQPSSLGQAFTSCRVLSGSSYPAHPTQPGRRFRRPSGLPASQTHPQSQESRPLGGTLLATGGQGTAPWRHLGDWGTVILSNCQTSQKLSFSSVK